MSGHGGSQLAHLAFPAVPQVQSDPVIPTRNLIVSNGKVVESGEESSHSPEQFTWPMGDCGSGEVVRMQVPLHEIHGEAQHGGNVKIHYMDANEDTKQGGLVLEKTESLEATESEKKRQKPNNEPSNS
jgi:hypothetical protein